MHSDRLKCFLGQPNIFVEIKMLVEKYNAVNLASGEP